MKLEDVPLYNLSVSLALDSSPNRRASGVYIKLCPAAKASPPQGRWQCEALTERFSKKLSKKG